MLRQNHHHKARIALFIFLFVLSPEVAFARFTGEAVTGQPFGIGKLTVPITDADTKLLESGAILLKEEDGRVHYPTFSQGAARRLLDNLIGPIGERSITAMFLFTGDAPLKLTVETSISQSIVVTPHRGRPREFNRLTRNWWRQYHAAASKRIDDSDYPPVVETYLTSMLSGRLGLDNPLLSQTKKKETGEVQQTINLLFGTESLRAEIMRETMAGVSLGEPADRPVPPDVLWALPGAVALPKVDVEPMASHVPEECFYARFGKFDNYIWLDHLLKEFADTSRLISVRGHDGGDTQRLTRQLALKQTKISELFGGTVISDVAILGRDLYFREGVALGIMFQASNSAVLGADITKQRAAALKENEKHGATIATVKLNGQDVSYLSTPDNRIRSYYAVDGDFHLVTTSRYIAQRFLEAGAGEAPLANSLEFRNARRAFTVDREDTVFVYLSSAFMRGLVSPQYQIELRRRLQSVADMELAMMARMAARAERKPADTIDDLVAGGFLPKGFGLRPDGSGPIITDKGVMDSRRGRRGNFMPIPDVDLHSITRSEEARYVERSAYYAAHWKQMDPIMLGVKRTALDDAKERLVIDGNIRLIGEEKYGRLLSMLGPPTKKQMTPAPGDIVNAQISIRGGLLLPRIPPHTLFVGVQDTAPPPINLRQSGFFEILTLLRSTPGYLGAWPKPGFLDLLPFNLGGSRPDALGYSRLPLGLWRRQLGGLSTLSFDYATLENVTPHLKSEDAETPAQVRARIGDLSQSRLDSWINTITYQRAIQTTMGNIRLLNSLSLQLQVPRAKALEEAERLLGVKLTCSLGGKYALNEKDGEIKSWTTSKLPSDGVLRVPEDYTSSILVWFRGANVELTKADGRMNIHAHLDMQRAKQPAAQIKLPSFNLFGSKKKKKAEPKPKPKTVKPTSTGREF